MSINEVVATVKAKLPDVSPELLAAVKAVATLFANAGKGVLESAQAKKLVDEVVAWLDKAISLPWYLTPFEGAILAAIRAKLYRLVGVAS